MSNVLLSANKGSLVEVMNEEAMFIDQVPLLLPNASIMVGNVLMTTAQVVAQMTTHMTTLQQLIAAKLRVTELVALQKTERAGIKILVQAIKAYVASTLGVASSAYLTLGFATVKAVPSVATKAAAALKATATKVKRHIMGKNQRGAIPPATEPEPAPAPAPTVATPNVTR